MLADTAYRLLPAGIAFIYGVKAERKGIRKIGSLVASKIKEVEGAVRHTGFGLIIAAFPSLKNGASALTFQNTHHAHKNVDFWGDYYCFMSQFFPRHFRVARAAQEAPNEDPHTLILGPQRWVVKCCADTITITQ